MFLPRSRALVWVLGAVMAAGTGLGSFAYFRHAAGQGQEVRADGNCPAEDEGLTLPESERQFLWEIEHGGNLLVRDGFGPMTAALRQADAPALLAQLSDDFQGEGLNEPREVAWRTDWLTAVRQTEGDKPPLALKRSQFVERLLEYRRLFSAEPKVKLSLMRLSPVERDHPDGPWQGTCQLRLSGEKAPGQPGEVIAYLRYRVRRPTEEGLKAGGWLTACAIEQSQVGHARQPLFREVAAERGLDVSRLRDNWKEKGEPNTLCGVYLCDYDRDGILDLLVNDISGIRLYKGLPGGRFRDVTDEAGLFWAPHPVWFAAFVDLDGDGWDDLILGQRVYRNDKGKGFTDVTSRCNLSLPPNASGIAVADFDRDGKLDLYVTRTGAGKADSWLSGKSGKSEGNQLWRNKGNWQFENVTAAAGADGGQRSTFTAIWLDANNDGWPDLYVPNEFGNGVLLVNQHDGTFKEQALAAGPSDFGSMGVTAGDVDNDGHIDLYSANMYSKAGMRVIGNLRPDAYPPDITAKIRTFVSGSQLHRNLGGLKFEQKGKAWQVNDCGWAYGAALIDLDNDGWLDLYATAGFISRDRNKPDG
jgi:hypothetical protein